jgi:hypothetical protein
MPHLIISGSHAHKHTHTDASQSATAWHYTRSIHKTHAHIIHTYIHTQVPPTDYFLNEYTKSGAEPKPKNVVKVYEAIHEVKKDAAKSREMSATSAATKAVGCSARMIGMCVCMYVSMYVYVIHMMCVYGLDSCTCILSLYECIHVYVCIVCV